MAQSSPADLVALIRLAVFASSATHTGIGGVSLNTYIRGRVQPVNLIDADVGTVDLPMIVVDAYGGDLEYAGGWQQIPLRLYCYAKDSGDAWAIHAAAFSVLHGTRLVDSSGVITMAGAARMTAPGELVYHDGMQAYCITSTWVAGVGG